MSAVATAQPLGAVQPTIRQRVRRNRGLIVIGLVLLVVAVLVALTQSQRTAGLLDPNATDPSGSKALATLLRDQGVTVVRETTAAAAAADIAGTEDATLVVAPTAPISEAMLAEIRTASPRHVVLLSPDPDVLEAYAPWASELSSTSSTDEVAPGCTSPVAQRAGALPPAGTAYRSTSPSVASCWGGGVLDDASDGAVTVVGLTAGFTNAHLGESGYAAMALGLTGRSQTLVWWLPSIADPLQVAPGEEPPSIQDLVPSWVRWALLQLVVATGVVVWWRGRRLGRVVVEPLPVVVRATESVEGRARLYRRGRARGRAADALRTSTLGRLRTRLSLPRSADVATVVAAVAVRTGRPETEITTLLSPGTDPTDDAGLTRLANALDALENEVRHP